jgi:hypothetical protein
MSFEGPLSILPNFGAKVVCNFSFSLVLRGYFSYTLKIKYL